LRRNDKRGKNEISTPGRREKTSGVFERPALPACCVGDPGGLGEAVDSFGRGLYSENSSTMRVTVLAKIASGQAVALIRD
jgi:hypothetical protein